MSNSSVTVEKRDEFRVIDYVPPTDDVVDDDTHIAVHIGEQHTVFLTVGRWRELAAAVNHGNEAIPGKRELRRATLARVQAHASAPGTEVAS